MRKSMKLNKKFWILVVAFTLLISGIGLISYYIINESTNLFKVMINRTFNALEENVIDSDSIQNNLTLKEAILELGYLTSDEFDLYVQPEKMIHK